MSRRAYAVFATMLVLFGVFVVLYGSIIDDLGNFFSKDIRHVSVCVLNDATYPVPENIIRLMLDLVFWEFREKTGVVFHSEGIIPFHKELIGHTNLWSGLFQKVCPAVEKTFFFTDRSVLIAGSNKEDFIELGGYAEPLLGLAMIFNVNRMFRSQDMGGNPLPLTSLRHEVAHLFGIDLMHKSGQESFMYNNAKGSLGRWTDEVIREIRRNRDIKWR